MFYTSGQSTNEADLIRQKNRKIVPSCENKERIPISSNDLFTKTNNFADFQKFLDYAPFIKKTLLRELYTTAEF